MKKRKAPLCSTCGKNKRKPNQRLCAECHAAYQREWRKGAAKRVMARIAARMQELGLDIRPVSRVTRETKTRKAA